MPPNDQNIHQVDEKKTEAPCHWFVADFPTAETDTPGWTLTLKSQRGKK